jgi:hypothetical protein
MFGDSIGNVSILTLRKKHFDAWGWLVSSITPLMLDIIQALEASQVCTNNDVDAESI